tara:strand:- start:2227 stop:2496 length:270 start_codon:yes stop_codon:yes gene_type:complete
MFFPEEYERFLTAKTAEERKQARFDIMFRDRSYQTSGSLDLNPFNIAYRADSKEQYYWDLGGALLALTGPTGRVARAVWSVVDEIRADN